MPVARNAAPSSGSTAAYDAKLGIIADTTCSAESTSAETAVTRSPDPPARRRAATSEPASDPTASSVPTMP